VNLSSIPGLASKRIAALEANNIRTLWDLLWYLPRKWEDLRKATKIRDIKDEGTVALIGHIIQARMRNKVLIVRIMDDTASIEIPFFNKTSYWMQTLRVGSRWIVVGKRKATDYGLQIARIDIRPMREGEEYVGCIEPVYTITETMRESGITDKFLTEKYKWLFEKNLSLVLPPEENNCPQDLL
jgi:ATP-dependent DNA helicase RecG